MHQHQKSCISPKLVSNSATDRYYQWRKWICPFEPITEAMKMLWRPDQGLTCAQTHNAKKPFEALSEKLRCPIYPLPTPDFCGVDFMVSKWRISVVLLSKEEKEI